LSLVPLPEDSLEFTSSTLKHTVLERGLHSPMTTWSPSFTRKQGEQCAGAVAAALSQLLRFLA